MIIETLSKSQFVGNETIRDSFSYEAAGALFDWYSELSEDCGEPIDLPELLEKYTLIIKLDSVQSWLVREF